MKDTLSKVVIFSLGAAVGTVVSWRILKQKYEQIAREEIASVKEVFSRRRNEASNTVNTVDDTKRPEDAENEEYNRIARDYNTISSVQNEEGSRMKKPYIISPDVFGDVDGYECVSLTYYADGVLTDEVDEVIENREDIVCKDFVDHFGENEGDEDTVYVRNDKTRCDYEILYDARNYKDVCGE